MDVQRFLIHLWATLPRTFLMKVKLGVSSRGRALRKEGNCNIVQDDFMLATADMVADPSHLMLLLMELWKERNGFGIMAY